MFTQATKQNEKSKPAADQKKIQAKEQNGLALSRKNSSDAGQIQRKRNLPGNWSVGSGGISRTSKIQTQVKIGQPNDKFEKEADAMADKVVSMPAKTQTIVSGDQPGSISRKAEKPLLSKITPLTQKKEEEVQNKEEEVQEKTAAKLQTKSSVGDTETPPSTAQRMCSNCSGNEDVQSKLQLNSDEVQTQTLQPQIDSVSTPNVQAESNAESSRGPPDSFESSLNSSKGGGQPLSKDTQSSMGSSFGADFSDVRVHTDNSAVRMNQQIGAQAFTHGKDIYFNEGKYSPESGSGKHLLAHELTHTIQQGAVVRPYRGEMHAAATGPIVQRAGPDPLAVDKEEIDKGKGVDKAIQARAGPNFSSAPVMVQGGWLGEKLNEYASDIPGWTLITVVVGYNPLTERDIERTPQNFLKGLMGLVPGGNRLYNKLEEHGLVSEAFTWLNQQLSDLDLSWRRVAREMEEAWDEMSIRYSFSTNLGIVKDHLYSIYRDVKEFGKRIIDKTIELVKKAILVPLGTYIRDNTKAWPLVTVLLGEDPLTGEKVERNLYNIASGFLMLDPDGEAYLKKLDESGKLQELSDWFDLELEKLNISSDTITQVFTDAWDLITLDNLLEPVETFKKIFKLFAAPLERIINFVIAVAMKILTAIKDWLIGQLKTHAHKVPGYPLLTVILGKDPVTQEEVPRTAENFIKGFMSFVPGGLEKFENLKKSGAIDKAFTWLEKAVAKLNLTFEAFLQLFIDLWESFTINDLLDPIGAFEKIINIFKAPVLRIINFAIEVGLKVLEFIFVGVMGPTGARVVAILSKAKSTFLKIIKNPIGFLGNLLKALGKGFKQFGENIFKHLLNGLIGWLTGALSGAGLKLPEKWDLKGIISLVMQILGLTWERIRKKLVKRFGEKKVKALEKTFEFVKILVTEGIAGVWRKFMEYVSGLKEKVIDGIKDWIVTKIVTIAITKLATLSNPVGAVIESILAIYNTVMFFIERINQILDLVEAIVNSIANIANGKLKQAADYVETSMARTIPVIISFMARLIGLGGISDAIKKTIGKVQAIVDKGIDKLIDWIEKQVKKLVAKGKMVIKSLLFPKKKFKLGKEKHTIHVKEGATPDLMIASTPQPLRQFLLNLKNSGKIKAADVPKLDTAIAKEVEVRNLIKEVNKKKKASKDVTADMQNVLTQENALAEMIRDLWNYEDPMETKEKYKLEGVVATFGTMPKAKFDKLTPDHQPQASILKHVATLPEFRGAHVNEVIKGTRVDGGACINLFEERHKLGRTYLSKGDATATAARATIASRLSAIPADNYEERRDAVISVLKEELNKDVAAMNAVASNDKNYEDIDKATSIENAKTVKKMVKKAILAGQSRIKSQNLNKLKDGAIDPPAVNPKKLLSNTHDPSEIQADSIADRVVNGQSNGKLASAISSTKNGVQRKAQNSKPNANHFESKLKSGGGKELDKSTKSEMETGFGADFSGVRVHTGTNAVQMSQSIGARAFTHGHDIYFNSGQYNPGSREGKHLLAHELTHTVQQGAAKPKVQAKRGPPARGSPCSKCSKEKIQTTENNIQKRAGPEVSQTTGGPFVQRGLWDSVTGAAGAVWDSTVGAVVDAAGEVINMTKDMFWSLLESVAPASLVSLVKEISSKGIYGFLKEKISSSLSSIFSGLAGNNEALQSLFSTFGSFSENIITIIEALASGDCAPLFSALDKFKNIISGIAGEAWNGIKEFFAPVGTFFSNLWSNFGAPVLDWLKETAGDVWAYIKNLGQQIWDWTSPVRSAAASAWDWLKDTIGMGDSEGGDSSGGIMGWITTKAQEVWDSVKQELSPIIEPIMQVANKIKEFLPLTAIANLKEKVLGWTDKINKMGQKMAGDDKGMNAEGQASLRGEILPAVMETIKSLSLSISGAGTWISSIIGDISTKVSGFLSTLSTVPLLSKLASGLNWLKEHADSLAAWAREKVVALFNGIASGLTYLSQFIEPILNTLKKIADVLGDLLGKFPDLILGPFWWILPECIKKPIKDFFIKTILSQIPFFGQLVALGDIWSKVKSTALTILTQIFVNGDLFMAIWTFFKSMLSLIGIPPELVTNIIIKASQAIGDILTNPIGFIINILKSVKLGFMNFFSNILKHLAGGVVDWLFGQVAEAGIELPADFSLKSILKFVFALLGLSVEKIWQLLEEKLGKEKVEKLKKYIRYATGVFEWVVVAMTEGPAGVWNKLVSQLNNLWTIVIGQVVSWISTKIIAKATQWLLSLLDVSGITPVINSLIAIWNAVESFAQNVTKILQIINSVVNGVADMAAGNIQPAADYLETALAGSIPVIISFLAGQFGLNSIGSKIKDIIGAVQAKIEDALRWLINKTIDGIGNIGRYISNLARRGGGNEANNPDNQVQSSSDLSPEDVKNNENIANDMDKKLKAKPAQTPKSFQEFYEDRKALAAQLIQTNQSKVLPGLKITVEFTELQQDQADNDVDYTIKIAPNTTTVTGSSTADGENSDLDDLDKDVPAPTTDVEKEKYFDSFVRVVDKIVADSDDTGDLARQTGKIKTHYKFSALKTVGDGGWALKASYGSLNRKAVAQKELKMGGVDLAAAGLTPDEMNALKFSTDVKWTTANLGGSVVGKQMIANPVGPDHKQGEGPKGGAQSNLMSKLETTGSGEGSKNKFYIRGHLLNDNVGGPGEDYNLYPITSDANGEHERKIESKVKDWVNTERLWVYYKVSVTENLAKLDATPASNKVNADFVCEAAIMGTGGSKIGTTTVTIKSEYNVTHRHDPTSESDADKSQAEYKAGDAENKLDPQESKAKGNQNYQIDGNIARYLEGLSNTDVRNLFSLYDNLGDGAYTAWTNWKARDTSKNYVPGSDDKKKINSINTKSVADLTAKFTDTFTIIEAAWINLKNEFGSSKSGIMEAFDQITGLSSSNNDAYDTYKYVRDLNKWGELKGWEFDTDHYSNIRKLNTATSITREKHDLPNSFWKEIKGKNREEVTLILKAKKAYTESAVDVCMEFISANKRTLVGSQKLTGSLINSWTALKAKV